jgi:hypothetical protein
VNRRSAATVATLTLAVATLFGGCRATAKPPVAFPGAMSCSHGRAPRGFVRPAHNVAHLPPATVLGLRVNLSNNGGRERCAAAQLARALGATMVREDLSWARVEPVPGVWRWGHYDAVFRSAAQHGLSVLPLLDDVPRWATGGNNESLPRDLSTFAPFAAAAAARYGPGGQYWLANPQYAGFAPNVMEVLNEPYGNKANDPARYATLLRDAATAVRSSNPSVGLLAAVAPGDWLNGLYAADPQIFATAATAGAAVHPYSTLPPNAPPSPESERRVETVHNVMAAHGDGGRGVWITEIGWSTCPASSNCVTENAQASDLAGTLRLAATRWQPWLRGLFIYQGREYGRKRNPGDKEAWFGLTRPNGTAKPAADVLAGARRRR